MPGAVPGAGRRPDLGSWALSLVFWTRPVVGGLSPASGGCVSERTRQPTPCEPLPKRTHAQVSTAVVYTAEDGPPDHAHLLATALPPSILAVASHNCRSGSRPGSASGPLGGGGWSPADLAAARGRLLQAVAAHCCCREEAASGGGAAPSAPGLLVAEETDLQLLGGGRRATVGAAWGPGDATARFVAAAPLVGSDGAMLGAL